LNELIDCLAYLVYKKQIYHRDIKPQNILLVKGRFKLSDFGEGKAFDCAKTVNTVAGTPVYMSPLLVKSYSEGTKVSRHDIEKSDIFSLGMTFL